MLRKQIIQVFLGILGLILTQTASADNTIYLIRHAEKQSDEAADPGLTLQGELRARNIATFLKDKAITHIFSTDYQRTLKTAEPSSTLLNIKIEKYDPSQLNEFAKNLKTINGNILVVGHSNTTPDLVHFIGGDPYGEIDESEFDRLYQVTTIGDKVETKLLTSSPTE